MNLEEFKEIPGYSRYMISPSGEVWDKETQAFRKWLNNEGYILIASAINNEGKKRAINVRRAVYQAFVDENLKSTTQLENIDGNIFNNHYTNIRPTVSNIKRRAWFMELSLSEDSKRRGLSKTSRSIWKSMMNRCYDPKGKAYSRYGGSGVVVCKEWKEYDNFLVWFKDNYIEGFALDKDLLVNGNKIYSPDTCVFIPPTLNSLLAHPETPVVERYVRGSYTLRCYISCKYVVFKGWSEEECLEQYNLVRQLQLEKLVYLMREYHESLKQEYPTTPEIDSRVLEKLEEMIR